MRALKVRALNTRNNIHPKRHSSAETFEVWGRPKSASSADVCAHPYMEGETAPRPAPRDSYDPGCAGAGAGLPVFCAEAKQSDVFQDCGSFLPCAGLSCLSLPSMLAGKTLFTLGICWAFSIRCFISILKHFSCLAYGGGMVLLAGITTWFYGRLLFW